MTRFDVVVVKGGFSVRASYLAGSDDMWECFLHFHVFTVEATAKVYLDKVAAAKYAEISRTGQVFFDRQFWK